MNTPSPRISQRDIAARAGVSVMTVSLALRGSTEISKQTVERVRKLAEEMGYVPNPLVSALMRNRKGRGQVESGLSVAWHGAATALRKRERGKAHYCDIYDEMLKGAREACRRNGFALNLFLHHESGPELPQVLRARGIRGLVLGPIGQQYTRKLALDQVQGLHLVRVAPSDQEDSVDIVERNFFDEMKMCVNALADAGCRKIGFIDYENHERQSGGRWKGAFLSSEREGLQLCRPELYPIPFQEAAEWLDRYIQEEHPDGLILGGRVYIEAMIARKQAGTHIPFCCLERNTWPDWISGVETGFQQIGASAVQQVIHRILSTHASYDTPQTTLIRSTWHEGNSHLR